MMLKFGGALLMLMMIFTASCTGNAVSVSKSEIVLVGSTPGEAEIKSLLSISLEKPIDFIRWDLSLDTSTKQYALNINFGEGQPNTSGFKGGGERLSFKGAYTVSKSAKGDIYRFTGIDLRGTISMIKLSENVFHILNAEGRLMVGDGGWSYTLSRKDRVTDVALPPTSMTTVLLDERFSEAVFTGRTPCVDFGRTDLEAGADCHKLKWKLTLFRDAVTNKPTTYKLESTVSRLKPVEGKWSFVTRASPRALIIELDPQLRDRTISFAVGDENVLFLLDKESRLRAGNIDFGYTLDRRAKPKQE